MKSDDLKFTQVTVVVAIFAYPRGSMYGIFTYING